MNDRCPECDLRFDRGQPGFFLGAMYVSYAITIPLFLVLIGLEHLLLPHWSLVWLTLLAVLIALPMIPWIFQYSRVFWIHFDRWLDPDV